ncbi:MAG: Rpn family recombination-promoting nuclease/putative transposase [Alphaproteobacteria bacterium]|nr:Rpn family recombination-promoting nuclease/putative transposase [Alphaproteobacteria bacterium]
MPTPHDHLVKAVFGEPQQAALALREYLPPAALRWVDLEQLERVDRSFVDEALSERHADILFVTRLHNAPEESSEALVYLLLEHQSTPDPLMPFRLLTYMLRIWERWLLERPGARRLPLIYPLVLYHGEAAWRTPLDLAELMDLPALAAADLAPALPHLRHDLVDLSAVPDEELRGGALAVLVQVLLKHHAKGDLVARLAAWTEVFRQAVAERGLRAVELVARYILEVDAHPDNEDRLRQLAAHVLGSPAQETVMTTADRLRAEGRLQGREEGREEGLQEGLERGLEQGLEQGLERGLRESVLRGIRVKFGDPTTEVLARVADADADTLRRWMEGLFVEDSLAALLRR